VFTGDEMGVMKAVEAASATIIAKGYGAAFRSFAIASATGAISTAVAVLEMLIGLFRCSLTSYRD
jgi:hypothetical protein